MRFKITLKLVLLASEAPVSNHEADVTPVKVPFTFLLFSTACCAALSYVRLCDPVDCSPLGSSVHGIFQARIMEWVAMPFSRGSS